MKTLSESLESLSAQVKNLEDSATSAFEADREALELRSQQIDGVIAADLAQFQDDARRADTAVHDRWTETKAALARPFDELKTRHERRKAEHELERANHTADAAEDDAEAAVGIAAYAVNVAEYAVIDATLARMAADDLVGDSSRQSNTVGAAS
jgi:ABC-type transport system involved in cytochrome bd biosynthesis fused ATPase/permease subunit